MNRLTLVIFARHFTGVVHRACDVLGFAVLVVVASIVTASAARGQPGMDMLDGNSLVKASLITEQTAVRAGSTIDVGILLEIEHGWHTYWNGKNDTGFPVAVMFELPNGVRAGAVQWPVPKRHLLPGNILDFVYEDSVLLISTIEVPEDIGEVANLYVKASVEWLVCNEACLPGSSELESFIPITRNAYDPPMSGQAPLFAKTREQLPVRLPKPGTERALEMSLSWNGPSFIAIVPDAKLVRFFPGRQCADLVEPIRETEKRGEELTIHLDEEQLKSDYTLQGILYWEYHDGQKRRYIVDIPWGDTKGLDQPR